MPVGAPIEKIEFLGTAVYELIDTIDHNLQADVDDLRFQRKVSYVDVSPAAADEFSKLAARQSQALLEYLNLWLANHDNDNREPGQRGKRVSLGIYYFETDSTENDS